MGVFDTLVNTRKSAVVPSTADPIYQRMEQQLGAVPEPETGYAAGGFRALARGITGMSREVGDMLQYNDTPGQENIVNRVGRWMSDTGQAYQDKISRPAPGGNEVKRSVFEAVENLPVSLGYSVPSIVGAIAGTTVGPGGTVAGSVAGQGLSSALMFRASAQRAYEDIMQANPGIDPARAMEAAKKVGHANWIGESVSNIPEAIAFSMLPGGKAISGGVKALIKPGVKTLARNLGISAASEQLGENWTSYQEAKAMNEVLPADKQQSPWEAVKQTIGPTAVMSLIMGGAGTGAQALRSRGTINALQDPTTDLKSRHLAMLEVATRLNEIDPKQAENWRKNAATALLTGSPIPLDDTFLQDPKIFHQQLMDDAEQLQRSTFPNAPYPGMVPSAASPAASPFDTSIVDPSLGVVPDRTPRSPITGLAIRDFGFEAPENAPVPISPITGKPVSNAVFMPDLTAQRLRLNRLLGLEAATAPGSAATPAASPFDTSLVDPNLGRVSLVEPERMQQGIAPAASPAASPFDTSLVNPTTGQVRIFPKPSPIPAPAVSSTPASAPFDTSLVDQTAGTAQLPVNPITGLPYRPVPLSGTGSEVFTPGVSPVTGKSVQDAIPMESITRELQRLESTKLETISPQNILDEVNQNQAYQRNKSGKGFTTTSDFTALMKERHPALAGIAKGDLVSALNKMVKGGKPTEKQQVTIDQITAYLNETNTHIQEEMKANAERAAALWQQQVAAQQEVQQERPIEDWETTDDSFDFEVEQNPEGYIQDPDEVQFSMKENDDATTAREIAQTLQGEQGKTINPARLSFSEHPELSTIGRAFGVTVRLYDYKGKENLGEGFVLGSDPKTVYVNKKASSPALTVLGHELTHQLVKNDIDLFIELVTYLKGEIELGRYAQYAATLRNIPAYNNLNNDALFVEVVGNIVGAQFGKTSFWERMAQKEPTLFSKLIGIAKSFLRSAKESINIFNASENVVRDIEKVEAVVASVFAKYARKAQEGTYQEGPKDSSIHFAFNGTEFLRPAVVRGGVVKVAPVGATHGDAGRVVVSKIPSGLADFTGFTTPDGQTLTRKEANEWLKVNRPEVYRALDKTTKQNGLESMAYAHAEGLKDTANDLADRFMREQFGVYSTKEDAAYAEPTDRKQIRKRAQTERLRLVEEYYNRTSDTPVPAGTLKVSEKDDLYNRIAPIAWVFGHDVILVDGKNTIPFTGAAGNADNDIIISDAIEDPQLVVLGHEITHKLRFSDEALYKEFATELLSLRSDEKLIKYFSAVHPSTINEETGNIDTTSDTIEEWVADVVGANFNKAGFWNAFANDNPKLLQRALTFIHEVIQNISAVFDRVGMAAEAIADNKKAEATIAKYMKRYASRNTSFAASAQTERKQLTKQQVQAAFRGQDVEETPEGFVVTLPNGFQIRVEKTGEISFNTQKAEEALGRKLLPGEAPVAAWKKFPLEGLIQLTERGMGELNHEVFHAAMSLALSKGERTKVLNQIKKANPNISDKQAEEIAAQEYNEWMNAETQKPNTVWQKIKDFAMRLKDLVFTSKEGVYRKVGSGKVWGKNEGSQNAAKETFSIRKQDGLRTTHIDEAFSFNTMGKTLTQAQEKLAQSPVLDQAIAFLTPMNRLIDIMLSRKDLAPIRSSIKTLGEWMQKQRTFQDDLLSDAKKIFDRALGTATGGRKIGHDPALVNQLHAMMSKMTLWGIDPSGTTGDKFGNEGTWEMSGMKDSTGLTLDEAKKAVAAQWAKVPAAMQKSIVEMLKANQRALALQKKVNLAVIDSLSITPETKAKLSENIKKRFDGMSGPYFPLSRYGKYVVSIKGDDGKKLWDSRFDSQGDALKFLAMVEKDPKAFLEAQGLANAATYQGFATSIDAVNPITRRQQYIPEAFLNRIKAAADSAGTIDLRKELRAIYRDAKKEEDANPGTYSPDVLQQVYDAAHAKTYEEANTAMAKLTTLASTAQEEQDLLKEVTSSIDGAGFRADIADRLKDDFEEIWFAALPETSVLKHLMKRKGILGYDQNMTRSFLTYHQKHARAMAFMKYGTKVNRELANIDKKAKEEDLSNESKLSIQNFAGMIRDHQNYMMSEKVSELVKKATKLSFAWYLSSPSAFLVQSSQPFTMAQPFLAARFGYSKAMGAINRAYGQQIKGEWTDAKLQEWNEQNRKLIEQIKDLDDEGKTKDLNVRVKGMEMKDIERLAIAVSPSLNISLSHEAMELIASGKPNDLELMKKIGTFMSVSETTSRKAGFLAAFRLKYNQTGDFAAAHKFATDMLNDVFFDYSSQNRPKLLTGNMGRFFGQFRVFQVQSLFKIGKLFHDAIGTNATLSAEEKKTARKELGFLLFNNFSLAGATGMPLMGSAVFLTNIVMNLFGDDDEPWDTEMEMSKMLREQLGEGVGTAAAKGWLPTLLGLDIAKRVGMGSIGNLFQSSPPEGKRGADLAGWYAMNAMGPAFNAVVTTPLRGAEAWQKGDWTDAARAGLPKPMADLVKAYQMFSEGQVTASGQTLKQAEDFNPYQVVMAALGVNPMEMSLAAEDYRMVTSYSTAISDRRTRLLKDFVRATLSDDYDAQEEAKDAISRFNEKMPKFAFKASDLANGLKDGLKKRRGELSKKQRAVQDYIGGEGNG